MLTTLIAFATLLSSPEQLPPAGWLCFDKSPCSQTSEWSFDVPAAKERRRFVWKRSDGGAVVLGDVSAGETKIDLRAKKTRTLSMTLSGEGSRGWPADVRSVVKTSEGEWRWNWRAREAKRASLRITLPETAFSLELEAPHHRPERRRFDGTSDVQLGQIALQPLPLITGRVVTKRDEKLESVGGAQISRADDRRVLGGVAPDGSFSIELEDPPPQDVIVRAEPYAEKVLMLMRNRGETLPAMRDFGEVVLAPGHMLTVEVERDETLRGRTINARLLQHAERYELLPIATTQLKADSSKIAFPNLEPGTYTVVLQGDGELERWAATSKIEQSDVVEQAEIEPYELRVRARFGEKAISDGILELGFEQAWRSIVRLDEQGRARVTAWQHSTLFAFLDGGGLTGMYFQSPELGQDPSIWNIDVPDRVISGTVLDDATGAPLADASGDLRALYPGGQSMSNVNVDANGRYRIAAFRAGTYDVTFKAPDRMALTKTFEIRDEDASVTFDVRLKRGVRTVLELVWPDGRSVASASLFEGTARDGHNPVTMYATDGAGRVEIDAPRGTRHILGIVPAETSLAAVDFVTGASETSKPQRVVVLPAVGTLRVRTARADGAPVGAYTLWVRYNGIMLPQSTLQYMRFDHLPAGTYEFWATSGPYVEGTPPPSWTPVRVEFTGKADVTVTIRE